MVYETVPTISAECLRALPAIARELDVDFDHVLDEAGIESASFFRNTNRVSCSQLEALFLTLERLSGCDWVAILPGRRCRLAPLSLAARAAPCVLTAGDGLRMLIEHCNLHDAVSILGLDSDTTASRVTYSVSEHGLPGSRHLHLSGMAIVCNVLHDLFGPEWRPTTVRLAGSSPSSAYEFEKAFRGPVSFNAEDSAIDFDRHWLDRLLPPVESSLRAEIASEVQRHRASMLAELPDTLRRILRKRLRLGSFSMDDVAAQLSMHRRTLDRRLQRHGTTYGALLEQVREEIARQLLRDTRLPIRSIAESVRFSSAANFATSFRRRVGMTPTEYRRQAA
jgi:AraC-like DNA-binding protein